MICKKCGCESKSKFCPECGNRLQEANKPNKAFNEELKKQLKRCAPIIILLFLVCLVITIAMSCNGNSSHNKDIAGTSTQATEDTLKKSKYTKVSTKELYEHPQKYDVKEITTTIKITDIDIRENVYSYVVYNSDKYEKATISAYHFSDCNLNKGDYITVSGECFVSKNNNKKNIIFEIFVDKQRSLDMSLFADLGGSEIKPTKATEKNTETQKPISYTEGHYKVGVDIPAGTYIAYPTDGWGGYYCISSDANGDNIIANQNFDGQDYFTVADGQYLELSDCIAYTLENKRAIDTSDGYLYDGEYLVGTDIPAGEYKVYSTDDWGGYYSLNSDANGEDIISNDNFDNSRYITISSGSYLELNDCKMKIN